MGATQQCAAGVLPRAKTCKVRVFYYRPTGEFACAAARPMHTSPRLEAGEP